MREVNEKEMLEILSRSKNVFLLEPNYERKYPPLGLAKIANFVKARGGRVQFGRSYSSGDEDHDLVCMTTLFTYDSKECRKAISDVRGQTSAPLLIGGICATLAPKLLEQPIPMFMQGENLLFKGCSKVLDQTIPDYSLDWGIDEEWRSFSFTFTSRGCVNKCPYCAVWRLEPGEEGHPIWVVPNWIEHIIQDKSHVMISDNNISASPPGHLEEVVEFLAGTKQTTIFDNGLDCKYISSDMAKLLAKVHWAGNGLRLAFDRIEEDGQFQAAVKLLLDAGVGPRNIMAYVLYNHYDSPKEAEYRLLECVKLGIQPYPQRFTPLNWPDRRKIHVGKKWTKALGCCFGHYGIMGKFRVQGNKDEVVSFGEFIRMPQTQERFGLESGDMLAYEAP